ncbi:hypothetical protein [Coraliomargarita parva]|uniref:hypothetical protein n=1 Tax=Coraliomargarita parva TaxID=3014050 RepID=UPI0022B35380|nr:hypothetical protein [Coraliomargarita parva]
MSEEKNKKFAWSLWLPVILAFVLVILGWITLIRIANENKIEMIPVPSNQDAGNNALSNP